MSNDENLIYKWEMEIHELVKKILRAEKRVRELKELARAEQAKRWIKANRVSLDQCQLSSGDDLPYFGVASSMLDWMRDNGIHKRFFEWNGVIYFTAEGVTRESTATLSDLRQYKDE